jgi:hypothetical protein
MSRCGPLNAGWALPMVWKVYIGYNRVADSTANMWLLTCRVDVPSAEEVPTIGDHSCFTPLDAFPRFIPEAKARLVLGDSWGPTCVASSQANCRATVRIGSGACRAGSC